MEQESKVSICEQLGVTVKFTFVPLSEARKRNLFSWLEDDTLSLCYECEVYTNGTLVYRTPYVTGSEVPNWVRPKWYGKDIWKSARKQVEEAVCELGRCPKQPTNEAGFFNNLNVRFTNNWVPIFPDPDDVLGCLVTDAQCAYHARTFEEFCSDLGYNDDSIKAVKTYEACKDVLIALMRHFDFEQLCKLFEDY